MIVRKDENGMLHAYNREDGTLDLYLRFGSALKKRDELAKKDASSVYEVSPVEMSQNLFNE